MFVTHSELLSASDWVILRFRMMSAASRKVELYSCKGSLVPSYCRTTNSRVSPVTWSMETTRHCKWTGTVGVKRQTASLVALHG